jgi:hypothetical protein
VSNPVGTLASALTTESSSSVRVTEKNPELAAQAGISASQGNFAIAYSPSITESVSVRFAGGMRL